MKSLELRIPPPASRLVNTTSPGLLTIDSSTHRHLAPRHLLKSRSLKRKNKLGVGNGSSKGRRRMTQSFFHGCQVCNTQVALDRGPQAAHAEGGWMSTPIDTVNELSDAISRGDLEAALALYEPNAAMVAQAGQLARGATA